MIWHKNSNCNFMSFRVIFIYSPFFYLKLKFVLFFRFLPSLSEDFAFLFEDQCLTNLRLSPFSEDFCNCLTSSFEWLITEIPLISLIISPSRISEFSALLPGLTCKKREGNVILTDIWISRVRIRKDRIVYKI